MAAPDWRFLRSAPPHYVARRLGAGESIVLDGRLDDAAWASAPWTSRLVDLTRHENASLNAVPGFLQARAKIRWDADFLYIGVVLREPLVVANVTGHNGPDVPYHDNDLELFVDAHRSAQHYKEFEMSARNGTYDVLWGVPDGAGLACARAGDPPYLPACVNTSSPFYAGNWTMLNPVRAGLAGGGLTTAVDYDRSRYGRYTSGAAAAWTAEIALPIRAGRGAAGGWHGGLLDAGASSPADFAGSADPAAAEQVYWSFDLSRAEHPRKYIAADGNARYCPFDCAADLAHATPRFAPPSSAECADVKARWPTLLGIDEWNCYWEWAIADVGADAYMHRPLHWATLEFAPASADGGGACVPIDWPGRYVARMIYAAQEAYRAASSGRYTESAAALLSACAASAACDATDLRRALGGDGGIFSVSLRVTPNASALSRECASRPCHVAVIRVHAPVGPRGWRYEYATTIDSNSWLRTDHSRPPGQRPCLPPTRHGEVGRAAARRIH